MKKTLIIFAALALLAACAKQNPANEVELVPMTFGVSVDKPVTPEAQNAAPELRTALSGTSVTWEEGDKIAIIAKGGTDIYEFTLASGAGTGTATFTGTCPVADEYYAFYPFENTTYYSVTGKTPLSGTQTGFQHRLRSKQVAREGNLPSKLGFSIGYSNGVSNLVMKNCLSLFKFQVADSGVKAVAIVADAGSTSPTLCGNFAAQYPFTDLVADTTRICVVGGSGRAQGITVLPPSEETTFQTGKTYYAVACPMNSSSTLSTGTMAANNYKITYSLLKSDKYFQKTSSSIIKLRRNTIYDMGTLSSGGAAWGTLTKDVWTADFSTLKYYSKIDNGDETKASWPTATSNTSGKTAYFPYDAAGNRTKIGVSQSSSQYCYDATNTSMFVNTEKGTRTGFAIYPSLHRAITKISVTLVKVSGDDASQKIYITESAGSGTSPWGSQTVDMSAVAVGGTKTVDFTVSEPCPGTIVCVNFYSKGHVRSMEITYDAILN